MSERTTSASRSADAPVPAEIDNETLNRKLAAYREQSGRLRPQFTKVYDLLVARLGMLDRDEIGPRAGERMPPFHLPDEKGNLVSLDSLLATGPAVISFNRGHWCPYCKLDLRSLAAIYGQIERLSARAVSIMPDSAGFTSGYAKENDLPFPVLSDIDLGYSLLLGLIFWVGDEISRLYQNVGIELEKYHGHSGHFLPIAAKFIVGQDGLVKARQIDVEFRRRMEPEEIIALLQGLRLGR